MSSEPKSVYPEEREEQAMGKLVEDIWRRGSNLQHIALAYIHLLVRPIDVIHYCSTNRVIMVYRSRRGVHMWLSDGIFGEESGPGVICSIFSIFCV